MMTMLLVALVLVLALVSLALAMANAQRRGVTKRDVNEELSKSARADEIGRVNDERKRARSRAAPS